MLEKLCAITLAICWIGGFFILAQIVCHQHWLSEKVRELERKLWLLGGAKDRD
jgi:hypothetical protein